MEALTAKRAELEKLANDVETKQAQLRKAGAGVDSLRSQLAENKMVKEELDKLADDAKVFKLVGPVLMPQDLPEAKTSVGERIAFIDKRVQDAQSQMDGARKAHQDTQVKLMQTQQEFQQMAQAAVQALPQVGARQ